MRNLLSEWRKLFTSNNLRINEGYASEERLSANLLVSLLTTAGLILLFILTPRYLLNPTPDLPFRVTLSVVGGIISLISAYFCRRGHHHTVVNIAVLVIPIWVIIASVARNSLDALLPLYYLSAIFIFVSMFLTERMMQLSFTVNTVSMVVTIALLPSVPFIKFLEGPLSFHIIISILTLLMVRYRATLENLRKQELKASEIRFRTVIDRSQDEFYLFTAVRDVAGQVTDFHLIDSNGKAEAALSNYAARETSSSKRMLSRSLDTAMQKRLFELYKSVLETRQTNAVEVAATTKDGAERWYYRQVMPVGDGIAILMRDITSSKLAEQRALELTLQREKVSILHTFIQDASHDLRTPLAVMRTSTYLLNALTDRLRKLLTGDDLNPCRTDLVTATDKLHQNSEQIVQSSERLHRLIEDMLEMTSLDYGTDFILQPRALNSVLHTLADKTQSITDRKQQSLLYTPSAQPLQVNIDEIAFSHALEHLLNNAIQFTPAGGQITLSALQHGDKVAIEIKDTGIGISAEEMPHIFERFYRADRARQQATGGTGLGLSIAQKIIAEHGGNITVESLEGHGSTFRVWLPLLSVTESVLAPQPTL